MFSDVEDMDGFEVLSVVAVAVAVICLVIPLFVEEVVMIANEDIIGFKVPATVDPKTVVGNLLEVKTCLEVNDCVCNVKTMETVVSGAEIVVVMIEVENLLGTAEIFKGVSDMISSNCVDPCVVCLVARLAGVIPIFVFSVTAEILVIIFAFVIEVIDSFGTSTVVRALDVFIVVCFEELIVFAVAGICLVIEVLMVANEDLIIIGLVVPDPVDPKPVVGNLLFVGICVEDDGCMCIVETK